jgi:hypothetical protein
MRTFTIIVIACLLPFALILAEETPDTVKAPVYAQPVLLTSVGQAADVLIMKGLSMRAGLNIRYSPQATADSLKGIKTLLLVAGGSSKGLGAAKIDPELEMDRVKALIKSAEKKEIPILVYHIGGEARRGALSDPFNKLAAEAGVELVVVSTGDKDGFFKEIAEDKGASYSPIEKQIDIVRVLKEQFGIE